MRQLNDESDMLPQDPDDVEQLSDDSLFAKGKPVLSKSSPWLNASNTRARIDDFLFVRRWSDDADAAAASRDLEKTEEFLPSSVDCHVTSLNVTSLSGTREARNLKGRSSLLSLCLDAANIRSFLHCFLAYVLRPLDAVTSTSQS